MSCRKATNLISLSMDRPLTRGERVSLRCHLVICGACRSYRRQLRALRYFVSRYAERVDETLATTGQTLSADARARIRHVIDTRER